MPAIILELTWTRHILITSTNIALWSTEIDFWYSLVYFGIQISGLIKTNVYRKFMTKKTKKLTMQTRKTCKIEKNSFGTFASSA